jgi:four helix bundle suffix protein
MTEAGYKYLKTYQLSVVIYDLTVEFCRIFLVGFDFRRLREQMIQAARSAKQNIAEGYLEKSLKGYIKLLGVAMASLEELLEDYEDFLRQRGLAIWAKNDSRVREFREIGEFRDLEKTPKPLNAQGLLSSDPERAANMLLTVGHQTSFLLDRQIKALEEKFVREGGYTEKLFQKRLKYRVEGNQ